MGFRCNKMVIMDKLYFNEEHRMLREMVKEFVSTFPDAKLINVTEEEDA